jgi:hypothetical protein
MDMDAQDQPTCGKGLAQQSELPAKLGELIASLAENLEVHMRTLDLKDQHTRQELDAYVKLASQHREIAALLTAVAGEMAGYRDLPMARHDMKAMTDPSILEAFQKFAKIEQELLALFQKRVEQNQKMLVEVQGAQAGNRTQP